MKDPSFVILSKCDNSAYVKYLIQYILTGGKTLNKTTYKHILFLKGNYILIQQSQNSLNIIHVYKQTLFILINFNIKTAKLVHVVDFPVSEQNTCYPFSLDCAF